MSTEKLPQTDSIQELANFWDSHDVTDFSDALEDVNETVFERDTDITVHLEANDVQTVREMAKSRGVRESDLVREWVLERIHAS